MASYFDANQTNMEGLLDQDQDPLEGTDFDNYQYQEPNFELNYESQQTPEVKVKSREEDLCMQHVPFTDKLEFPTVSTPSAYVEAQQFGNGEPYLDTLYGVEMDGTQLQSQEPQGYDAPVPFFNEQYLEQTGFTQGTSGMAMATSEIDHNTFSKSHQRLSLSVDTKIAAAYDGDGSYDSDGLLPLSGHLPADSPLNSPITTFKVNNGQPHTIQRRNSTPLITHGKIKRTTRRNQDEHIDPETLSANYYGKPPPQKRPWGPVQKNGKPLFSYNRQGELCKGRPLTIKEMRMYLFDPSDNHEEHSVNWTKRIPEPGERRKKGAVRSGLTLWLGWTPAQVSGRYPSSDSNKCKLLDCALDSRTIKTGDPRVIFDERENVTGANINPFWNAAYCHLYCFEKHFNLVQLLSAIDLRLDDRVFQREEQNLSVLKPDECEAGRRWFNDCWPDYCKWHKDNYEPAKRIRDKARQSPGKPLPAPAVEQVRLWSASLTSRIMEKSLELESRAKAQQRKKRREVKKDSCDRDIHRGDLDLANRARRIANLARNQRVKSHYQGEDFRKDPPKVGQIWNDFQHQREHNQQQQWHKSYPFGMPPRDLISANEQALRPVHSQTHPFICPSSPTTLPSKRSREIESGAAPGEDSRSIKRQRQTPPPDLPRVARSNDCMTIIKENPSSFQVPETGLCSEGLVMEHMQVGDPYVSWHADQSADHQPPSVEVHDMFPSSYRSQHFADPGLSHYDHLQMTGADPVDAVYVANPYHHGLPAPEDEYAHIKEDDSSLDGILNVLCADEHTKVKAEAWEDVNIPEFAISDTPPTLPGAPSSTSKRKRCDDGNEEESDAQAGIKRRCSESSR